MFQLTPLVRNLIIINVVFFLLQQFIPVFANNVPLNDINSGHFQPYQFFTYMFAHGDFFHILFNMFAIASFAPILEGVWGEKKLLFYYLATGIGAGVVYIVANYFFFQGHIGSMVGASGAIYGILIAFGLTFPEMEVRMFFGVFPIKAKYMVFVIGFITYIMDRSGQVAHLAHFGGAFVGLIILNVWKGQSGRN